MAAEFLRRAQPLDEIVGRIEVRRGRMARVPVPVDCPGNRRGCLDEQTFDEAVRFDFIVERRSLRDGSLDETETPAGTILVAASFSDRGRFAFWDGIEAAAQRLAAEAFASPFAGWSPGQAPFDGDSVVRSADTWWGCFESSEKSVLVHFIPPARRGSAAPEGTAFGTRVYGPPPDGTCAAIRAATGSAQAEAHRTAPSPLRS
ncbi:MAG TPA: hypothetical protein VFD06_05605, partial [Candidatus Polarisedimenticolia bacterium]|nr:hypothetical protein [Candidatus Polarisedimenticolia bacterium]